ncbi:xanthine dehydrogenase YagR molybdenum-binding subunit [Streptomyces sp. SAI-126]|uniref:xanthine dehydrogenase family protein molybdopterin-binding subunit n=1 Tax=Streptomyces sp. SAI-126 TaxID=3377732 RepID=UPI003C7CADD1
MTETLPHAETGGSVVGKPVDRVDGPAKTTGAAVFSAEVAYPDLAYATLVPATISRGRITSIDTAAATAVRGVITVLTHENAPELKPPQPFNPFNFATFAAGTQVNYLRTDEIFWDGQPVALVVAETLEAAREAAALVHVTYEERASAVDFAAEEGNAQPQKANMVLPSGAKKGDAEAAFAASPVKVDLRFTTPPHNHNAIEPHATTAVWDGDRLTVHDSTQSIDWLRTHLALRFDVPPANVRVVSTYVGGGFGGKSVVWAGTILTALAARAVARPVRMMLTREAVYHTVGARGASTQRVALGAGTDGRLTSLIHTTVARTGRVGGLPETLTSPSRHLYATPTMLLQQNLVEMDLIPPSPMRTPSEGIGSFALESAIDELAGQVGMDPIRFRMLNEPETNPVDGKAFSRRLLPEAYALGAEMFGWDERTPEPGSMRDGRWLVGMGVATAFHPAQQMAANVTVRLSVDGSVLVRCAFQEIGVGAATVQAQIAADALGVPFENVRVEHGDSALPSSAAAIGSVQTATVANSLLEGCEKLKKRMRSLARRHGTTGQSHTETLARAGLLSVEVAVGSDTRVGKVTGQVKFFTRFLREQRRWMKAAYGAHFCEVRVDRDTGEVRVARWTGVFDFGRVINTKTATSQLRGGIIAGIGMAMGEETLVDPRNGRIMNPSLAEYHLPVQADIPRIEVACLDQPDPTMPMGLIGIGEVGPTGVAAAIANAVHHATGKRIRDLPITLDKLL